MYIYWLGESSFRIKGEEASVVIDPADKSTGLAQSALPSHLVLVSHALKADIKRISPLDGGHPFVIDTGGEYEVHGVFVYASETSNNQLLYLIKMDNIQIAHLCALQGALTDQELELFEGADIALIPVGNEGALDAKTAVSLISQLEPKIVIPTNFEFPRLNIPRKSADAFLSQMGVKGKEGETSLYVTESKLEEDGVRVVLLKP